MEDMDTEHSTGSGAITYLTVYFLFYSCQATLDFIPGYWHQNGPN